MPNTNSLAGARLAREDDRTFNINLSDTPPSRASLSPARAIHPIIKRAEI
jgi:hypothetical protein